MHHPYPSPELYAAPAVFPPHFHFLPFIFAATASTNGPIISGPIIWKHYHCFQNGPIIFWCIKSQTGEWPQGRAHNMIQNIIVLFFPFLISDPISDEKEQEKKLGTQPGTEIAMMQV